MVVMPKQNVPALRLEGFDGEWEESTIGSQAEIVMGQSPHGSSYNTKSAGEVLVQGNADLVDGWVTPRIWTTEPTRIAEPGTLIMSVRAPVGAMGKTRHRVVLGRGVAGIRGNEYIFQYLTKLEQDSYWSSKSSGSTFDSVNGSEIRATQISVPPTLEEQQAIGAVFTNLDAAINQHTLKHTSLQQAKTALMQRMFPQEGQTVPELRLEGFSGRWSYRRLCELAAVKDSARIHNSMWATDGVRYIRSSDVKTGLRDCDLYISHKVFDRYSRLTGSPRRGDVLFTSGGEIGVPHFYDSDEPVYLQGGAVLNVVTSESKELDGRFLTVLFETTDVRDYIAATSTGGTIKHFVVGPAREIPVFLPPTLEEQQAIGAIFTNLDQLIAAEARYIASLKQAKTALLQRMFI